MSLATFLQVEFIVQQKVLERLLKYYTSISENWNQKPVSIGKFFAKENV